MVPSFSGFPRSSCFFLLLPALLARCFWPVDFISCTDARAAFHRSRLKRSVLHGCFPVSPFPVHGGGVFVQNLPAVSCFEADFPPDSPAHSLFHRGGSAFCAEARRLNSTLKSRTKGPPKSKLPAVCLLWYKHTTGREYLPEFSIVRFCVQSIISADFWQFYRRFSGKRREWPKFFRRSPACGRCRPAG